MGITFVGNASVFSKQTPSRSLRAYFSFIWKARIAPVGVPSFDPWMSLLLALLAPSLRFAPLSFQEGGAVLFKVGFFKEGTLAPLGPVGTLRVPPCPVGAGSSKGFLLPCPPKV